ncbi:hypothetical protein GQ457_09G014470 [Hibiscus cannabinus]
MREIRVVRRETTSFEKLKEALTNAPVLIQPVSERELYMRQRRWLELLKDYDLSIEYHPVDLRKAVARQYFNISCVSIAEASIQRAPVCWAETRQKLSPLVDILKGTTEKVKLICDQLKIASDRQKSYVDLKCREIEASGFSCLPVVVASRVERIHDVFHVSMLRRYRSDLSHVMPVEEIELNPNLSYDEEPVEILASDSKVLRGLTGFTALEGYFEVIGSILEVGNDVLLLGNGWVMIWGCLGYFGCESDAKSSYNVELMFAASFDSKMGCLYSVFDVKKQGKTVWVVRARNWKLRGGENRLSGLLEGVSCENRLSGVARACVGEWKCFYMIEQALRVVAPLSDRRVRGIEILPGYRHENPVKPGFQAYALFPTMQIASLGEGKEARRIHLDLCSSTVFGNYVQSDVDLTPDWDTVFFAAHLTNPMASNYWQFGELSEPNRRVHEVNTVSLENKLDQSTNLVSSLVAEESRSFKACGICTMTDHPTDYCLCLQVYGAGNFPGPPQMPYDPYGDTYNLEWQDHPNFSYAQDPWMYPTYQPLLAQTASRLESQIQEKFPSQTELDPEENVSVITLRSETVVEPPIQEQKEAEKSLNSDSQEEDDTTTKEGSATPEPKASPYVAPSPFPVRVIEEDKRAKEEENLDVSRKGEVHIPLLEVIREMPRACFGQGGSERRSLEQTYKV